MAEMAEAAERPVSMISGDTPFAVANIPLPSTSLDDIREPRAPYMATSSSPLIAESPRDSYLVDATTNGSGTFLADKREEEDPTTTSPKSKRLTVPLIILLLVALVLIITAVIVPVYFFVIKPKMNLTSSNSPRGGSNPKSGGPGGPMPSPGSPNAITGGNGSTIHAADGTTFIYNNPFGGFCKCFADFIVCPTETVEARVWSVLINPVTITDHILSRG